MSTQQIIISAIQQRAGLNVNYKGTLRSVCPHRIGWKRAQPRSPKAKKPLHLLKDSRKYENHINVFVYQFGGYSSRGLAPDGSADNWRCWDLEDIYSATVIPIDRWHTGAVAGANFSACIDDIVATV